MNQFEVVLEDCYFLEGPRWRDGRLWASDFHGHRVVSTNLAGDVRVEAELSGVPSGLGWLPDGQLLIVSMQDKKLLRREADGDLVEHADLSSFADADINDMLVDDAGRAYISCVGFDSAGSTTIKTGPLLRVAPDGTASIAASDLYLPNGIALLPGGVLVVAETLGNRLTAFDVQADGSLTGRRVWAPFGPLAGTDNLLEALPKLSAGPDGLVVDAENAVWVADSLGSRVLRVAEGGEILQEISTAPNGVFSCTLGGSDGRTLFLCCAPDFDQTARAAKAEAKMLAISVTVPAR